MSNVNSNLLPSMIQNRLHPEQELVRIKPQYRFEPHNTPQVSCVYHPKEFITYFCKEQECLMPLCSACVKVHNELHETNRTRKNIIPYDTSLTEAYTNMAAAANQLCDCQTRVMELAEVQSQGKQDTKQSLQTNPLQLIDAAAQQVHKIVDNYFDTLKTYIQSRLPAQPPQVDPIPILNDLRQRWEDIIAELEVLNTPDSVSALIHHHQGNLPEANAQLLKEAEKAIYLLEQGLPDYRVYGIDIPQLYIDPTFLPQFLWVLERYAYFQPPHDEPPIDMLPRMRFVEPVSHWAPRESYIVREPIREIIREPYPRPEYRESYAMPEYREPYYDDYTADERPYRHTQTYPDEQNRAPVSNVNDQTVIKTKHHHHRRHISPRVKNTDETFAINDGRKQYITHKSHKSERKAQKEKKEKKEKRHDKRVGPITHVVQHNLGPSQYAIQDSNRQINYTSNPMVPTQNYIPTTNQIPLPSSQQLQYPSISQLPPQASQTIQQTQPLQSQQVNSIPVAASPNQAKKGRLQHTSYL